ncbi:MAG: nucleoside deaminase [Alphaproteobacteria bacterium]|nr:nucleoside deaminase [Alphaproteobacteria bacterium]
MTHSDFMIIALKEAQKAFLKDEVPVGAVIVDLKTNKIIAKAHNQTEHGLDPTKHAEISVIRKACRKLQTKRLWGCAMYVTLEPCAMCAAAVSFARIEQLIIGAEDTKGGAVLNGVRFFESKTCHFKPSFQSGIMAEESSQLLKKFFIHKRKNNIL